MYKILFMIFPPFDFGIKQGRVSNYKFPSLKLLKHSISFTSPFTFNPFLCFQTSKFHSVYQSIIKKIYVKHLSHQQ